MPSRRRYLAAVGAAGVPLAGCSYIHGSPSADEPPEAGVDDPPEPRSDLHGADGEWSSFGCNASNARITTA
ncbi:pyrrolo-quinoline quinone, partial [Natronoarchaeum mannanilyticum]